MLKVNNKDARTPELVSLLFTLNIFIPCSSVAIVNLEQVIVGWKNKLPLIPPHWLCPWRLWTFDMCRVEFLQSVLWWRNVHGALSYQKYTVSALQIRVGQRSVTANLWSLIVHIYYLMIIVTSGFSQKSFFIDIIYISKKSFEGSWTCFLGI